MSEDNYKAGYDAALRARGITTQEADFRSGYHAGDQDFLRTQFVPLQARANRTASECAIEADDNRTIEFNKGYRAGYEVGYADGQADVAGAVASLDAPIKSQHDEGYEQGYADAFAVAANADENVDLRIQAFELAIEAHDRVNIANTITTTAASILHFLKTGTPYTGARVLNADLDL